MVSHTDNYTPIRELVREWREDAESRSELQRGRLWVADAFYGGDISSMAASLQNNTDELTWNPHKPATA